MTGSTNQLSLSEEGPSKLQASFGKMCHYSKRGEIVICVRWLQKYHTMLRPVGYVPSDFRVSCDGAVMKKFVVAAAFTTFGFIGAANAADMPTKAPMMTAAPAAFYNWTGFYIGANVGIGGSNSRSLSLSPADPVAAALLVSFGNPPGSFNTFGALGGVQLGYNWQFNRNWLLGIEADFDWTGIKGSSSASATGVNGSSSAFGEERVKWFGTVRGRLGFLPLDNFLAYVTGGFAYGSVALSGNYTNLSGNSIGLIAGGISAFCAARSTCFAGSSTSTVGGWTVGGGFEYALWRSLSVKSEYLYVSLDSKTLAESATVLGVGGTSPAVVNADFGRAAFHVARVGVNYRF